MATWFSNCISIIYIRTCKCSWEYLLLLLIFVYYSTILSLFTK